MVDVVVMKMIKDLQYRSLFVIASKAKQEEGEGG